MRFLLKLLILGFVVLFGVAIFSSVFRACGSTNRITQPVQPVPQVQQQIPQPLTALQGKAAAPGQPAGPAPTAPAVMELRPMIVDTDPAPLTVRGKAILDVYNVQCAWNDILPQSPVFSTPFSETETGNMQYASMANNVIFADCTLGRLHWLYYAPEEGTYIFGMRLTASSSAGGVRINGIEAVHFQKGGSATNEVKLKRGWYDMEFRYYKEQSRIEKFGWSLLVKKPSDTQMNLMQRDDLFAKKEELDKFQTKQPEPPAKGKKK